MDRRREPRRIDGNATRRHEGRRQSSHVRQSDWRTVREEKPTEVFDESVSL